MYLEFNLTEFAGPAWPLDLEHSLSISILDGKPWVDEGAVLPDPPHSVPRRRLNLHLLQTTETAPSSTPIGTNKMDDLNAVQGLGTAVRAKEAIILTWQDLMNTCF